MDLYQQLHNIMMRNGEQQNGHDFESQNQNNAGPSIEQPAEQILEPTLPPPPLIMLSPPSSLMPAPLILTTLTPREESKPSCSKSKDTIDKVKLKKREDKKEKSKESEKKKSPVLEKSHKPERSRMGESTLSGIQAVDSERLEISLKNFKFEIYDMKV
jgi:hypothetical protein